MTIPDPDFDAVGSEATVVARTTFDLKKKLTGRPMRTDKITLYSDEVTGLALGDDRVDDVFGQFGNKTGEKVVREGALGRLAEAREALALVPEGTDAAAALQRTVDGLMVECDKLKAKLESTALTLELRNVPQIVKEKADRDARKRASIKGSIDNHTDLEIAAFRRAHQAELLAASIISITDHESDGYNDSFDYDDAVSLREFLPESEFARLDSKLVEVLFTSAVGESVTAEPDFSQGI